MSNALRIAGTLTLGLALPVATGGAAILERNMQTTMLAGAVSVVFLTLMRFVDSSRKHLERVQSAKDEQREQHFMHLLKQQRDHYEDVIEALRLRVSTLETRLEKQRQSYESQIGHLERTIREQAAQMQADELKASLLNQKYHQAVQDLYRATKQLYAIRKRLGEEQEPESSEIEASFSALDTHMRDLEGLRPTQVDGPMYVNSLDGDDEEEQ